MKDNYQEQFFFRDFEVNDYKNVISLWISLDLGRPERGDNLDIIVNTLRNNGKLIILEDKITKELIGTSWITNDQRRLYLHHFGIKKEYQRRGLAKLLLYQSLKFAKETRLQIKIEVHKTNIPALELYKKYDFKYLGDYEVYIIREYK